MHAGALGFIFNYASFARQQILPSFFNDRFGLDRFGQTEEGGVMPELGRPEAFIKPLQIFVAPFLVTQPGTSPKRNILGPAFTSVTSTLTPWSPSVVSTNRAIS